MNFVSLILNFLPILVFVVLYLGTGIYFSLIGVENAFYQLPPVTAILPALMLGWVLHKGSTEERMKSFLEGVRHRDIITMCVIFLLAGAFSKITQNIGSADSVVNLALSFIPARYLLIGLFLTTAFISTAIGTALGTIATLAPIALGLAHQGAFSLELGMGTVVAGAMFGDNLSVISDTTIAAVMSQGADMRKKLRVNAHVALIASLFTLAILLFVHDQETVIPAKEYSVWLIFPYLFLLGLAVGGVNVFTTLILAIIVSGVVGHLTSAYPLLTLCRDIDDGFSSVREIMILSMMVGGLSGLSGKGAEELAVHLTHLASRRPSKRIAQLLIAKLVSVFDLLLANNVIATIFSGGIAKEISKKYHIPPHYTAAWLDTFSCVFQGIIPYGAQILLASAIADISPLSIVGHVYYCYVLGVVSILYILCVKNLKE